MVDAAAVLPGLLGVAGEERLFKRDVSYVEVVAPLHFHHPSALSSWLPPAPWG